MARYVTVVPAYGRDYKSRAEVMADWEENKDFALVRQNDYEWLGGRYVNKTGLAEWNSDKMNVKIILHIRYRKLERIVEVRK